jgi:hypothetical protein
MFFTSPKHGDFYWSDAPRHALNGIFLKDLIAHHPLEIIQYAKDYYIQYPALTIGFYPPLFYIVLAAYYTIFGTSHYVAQACVATFYFGLGVSAFFLSKRWLPTLYALNVAILLMSVPEIALWGRQVMLDIPAFAWLLCSTLWFLKYIDTNYPKYLYISYILFVCTLYTKQTLAYMIIVFTLSLIIRHGKKTIKCRELWIANVILIIAIIPLIILTVYFGQINIQQTMGSENDIQRNTIDAWVFYIINMPTQLGWPIFILAIIAVVSGLFGKHKHLWQGDNSFLVLWFVVGYFYFSAISLKESRHDMTIFFPIIITIVLFLYKTAAKCKNIHIGKIFTTVLAIAMFIYSAFYFPTPYVNGYDEAAAWTVKNSPSNSVVLFSGKNDGSFIFNVKSQIQRNDISILRADKILLQIAIKREFGVVDRNLSCDQILKIMYKYRIYYVVDEIGFWTDLPSMKLLDELLKNEQYFRIVKKIISNRIPGKSKEILIYQNMRPIAEKPASIDLEMLGIKKVFKGNFSMEN